MASQDDKVEKLPADHVEAVGVTKEAKIASQSEKEATFWQALKSNKKSALWSAVISLTIIMEGYDIGLIYQFFAYPSFAEQFGHWDPATETYQVSGPWQAGLSNGANCGVIIGGELLRVSGNASADRFAGFLNGYLSAKYGYKKVILGALFCMNWLVFLPFFAQSPEVLLVGQILCGLTWGVFATTGRKLHLTSSTLKCG